MLKTNLLNPLNIIGLTYSEIEHLFTVITAIFKLIDKSKTLSELETAMKDTDYDSFTYGFTETTMWVKQIVNGVTDEKIIVLVKL